MRWMSAKNEPPDSWVIVLAAYKKGFPKSCITAAKRSDTHWITTNLDPIETPDYWAPIAKLPKDGD